MVIINLMIPWLIMKPAIGPWSRDIFHSRNAATTFLSIFSTSFLEERNSSGKQHRSSRLHSRERYFVAGPALGARFLALPDPRFSLPGLVGVGAQNPLAEAAAEAAKTADEKPVSDLSTTQAAHKSDIFSHPLNRENQVATLYSAHDYIKYTPDSNLCQDILQEFPELPGMRDLKCELHEAPVLLKKEIAPLFPDLPNLTNGSLSVITLAQKTVNDMSTYTSEMDDEREDLTEHFVAIAKEICAR